MDIHVRSRADLNQLITSLRTSAKSIGASIKLNKAKELVAHTLNYKTFAAMSSDVPFVLTLDTKVNSRFKVLCSTYNISEANAAFVVTGWMNNYIQAVGDNAIATDPSTAEGPHERHELQFKADYEHLERLLDKGARNELMFLLAAGPASHQLVLQPMGSERDDWRHALSFLTKCGLDEALGNAVIRYLPYGAGHMMVQSVMLTDRYQEAMRAISRMDQWVVGEFDEYCRGLSEFSPAHYLFRLCANNDSIYGGDGVGVAKYLVDHVGALELMSDLDMFGDIDLATLMKNASAEWIDFVVNDCGCPVWNLASSDFCLYEVARRARMDKDMNTLNALRDNGHDIAAILFDNGHQDALEDHPELKGTVDFLMHEHEASRVPPCEALMPFTYSSWDHSELSTSYISQVSAEVDPGFHDYATEIQRKLNLGCDPGIYTTNIGAEGGSAPRRIGVVVPDGAYIEDVLKLVSSAYRLDCELRGVRPRLSPGWEGYFLEADGYTEILYGT
ncbi:hypothetical protein A3709_19950 [Halioglobus sp. HI00S01]|uniref:hypothetical protein n=1 Tax=Halioglobus sp. HI00S01 TaxID=1822214 RepID=UPI0007C346E8|nr:hypothetical protein [Halioglobus sp. HI00S01]KZX57899.1 hypothetical protein A3709_19950 [Halioglobus sp. HI00S01]